MNASPKQLTDTAALPSQRPRVEVEPWPWEGAAPPWSVDYIDRWLRGHLAQQGITQHQQQRDLALSLAVSYARVEQCLAAVSEDPFEPVLGKGRCAYRALREELVTVRQCWTRLGVVADRLPADTVASKAGEDLMQSFAERFGEDG